MDRIKIQVYTHSYKANLLFEDLQEKIKEDVQSFHRLLEVFSENGFNLDLVNKLKHTLQQSKGMKIMLRSCTCKQLI